MLSPDFKFHFDLKCFHTLSKICPKKDYALCIGNHNFRFSLEEMCLIAPKVFQNYQLNHSIFLIPSEKSDESEQLIQVMELIQSLFINETQILLKKDNEQIFSLLASKFANSI
jgi:hypothetical protein